jgi:antitoxin component YwqK of YwqJK toxin-antitoxin module
MRVNIDDTDFDDDLRYFYKGEPFTGEAVETDPAGRVIALTTFRNGIEHGPNLGWYSDGTRRSEIQVINGNAVGTSRHWHRNGQLAEENNFDEHGELVSRRRWNEDGSPAPVPQRALDHRRSKGTA